TTRARLPDVIATVGDKLGLWQVFGCGDPGAGVGSVLTWTEHRVALLVQRFGPALYAKRLLGATRCPRYSLSFSRVSCRLAPLQDVCIHIGAGRTGWGVRHLVVDRDPAAQEGTSHRDRHADRMAPGG